jgi:polynucleotide 5'-kinase involved in rRNA processing
MTIEIHDDIAVSWVELAERVDRRCSIDKPGVFVAIDDYLAQLAADGTRNKDDIQTTEANVLFIGEEGSGKTSLINLCLGHKGEMFLRVLLAEFHILYFLLIDHS